MLRGFLVSRYFTANSSVVLDDFSVIRNAVVVDNVPIFCLLKHGISSSNLI
jgi:hypothetical protein